MQSKGIATLTWGEGKSIELPIYGGALGPDVIDIRQLGKTGMFTYDPGFLATASCQSRITFIDGGYLLLNGELPSAAQRQQFVTKVQTHTMVHDQLLSFFKGFRRDAHPMAVMVGVVGALSAFYHDSLDINNAEHRATSANRLIAKVPTIAAMCYRYNMGLPFMYPQNHMSYAENFLYMMFATPCEPYKPSPVIVRAFDRILTLHADHEQNASTSTVRLAGSSGANPFACISAGIAALWGPAHGGANEAVLKQLAEIGDVSQVPAFIARVKDKNDSVRLMGFGHRVYKNMDPRAEVMRRTCHEVLNELGLHDDPLFKLAIELERIALSDSYLIEKKLYPNVDFYSGIVLRALGIPTSMFTAIFAVGRTVGWVSQWTEMIADPEYKIGRPRQLYQGQVKRDVLPIGKRE